MFTQNSIALVACDGQKSDCGTLHARKTETAVFASLQKRRRVLYKSERSTYKAHLFMQFFHRDLTSLPLVLLMGLIACTNALPVDNDYDLALKPRETDDPFEFVMDGCRGVTCTAASRMGDLTEYHQSQLACAGPF